MTTAQFAHETPAGEFVRQVNRFTDRITRDSDSGPGEGPDALGRWPVESGRYRLVWSRACPWAHRARIVWGLLGLTEVISLATVDPIRDEDGWRFTLDPGGRDPVLGIKYLAEAYLATDPSFAGRVTVPAIIDTLSGYVVTNDYPQITLDLSTEWVAHHRAGAPDLYPVAQRPEIDALMLEVFTDLNDGVYRAGFASSQEAYQTGNDGCSGAGRCREAGVLGTTQRVVPHRPREWRCSTCRSGPGAACPNGSKPSGTPRSRVP